MGLTHCREDQGIEVCIDKGVYSTFDSVRYSLANGFDRTVYEDLCPGGVEGRRTSEGEWSGSFGGTRLCYYEVIPEGIGSPEGTDDPLFGTRQLSRGEVVTGAFQINQQAYEGEWRIWVRVLGPDGSPVREQPFTSPIFTVEH